MCQEEVWGGERRCIAEVLGRNCGEGGLWIRCGSGVVFGSGGIMTRRGMMARFLVLRRGWLVRAAVVSLVVACGVMAMYALFAARIHNPKVLRAPMGSMRYYSASWIWLVGERSTWGVDECFLQRMSDPTSIVTTTVVAAVFEVRWPGVDQVSSIYRIEENRYGLPFRFLSNTRVTAVLANGVINYNSDDVTRVLFVGCCGNVLCVAVGVCVRSVELRMIRVV